MSEKIEIWRSITGYEGFYEVSNRGRIKCLSLTFKSGIDYKATKIRPEQVMYQHYGRDGYYRIMLSKDGKRKSFLVHRLVALSFIDNPSTLPEINHKDGNKWNNHSSNLEWCERSYNIQHAVKTGLKISPLGAKSPTAKNISQHDLNGKLLKTWSCIKEASEQLNIGAQSITHVLKGRWKQTGGYKFSYA